MNVVTFGEVMGRLAAPGYLRLRQALPGALDVTFAGAEANVAASLAMLGLDVGFITALPRNPIADACLGSLRAMDIDTQHVVRTDEGRLGLYFLETGANQRPSQVTYDRSGSSISLIPSEAYPWAAALKSTSWFHTTGITPAISEQAAESALKGVRMAQELGCRISCDLNFRKKLWRWKDDVTPHALAEATMRDLLAHVDVVIANEEDCETVLGIHAGDTDVSSGKLAIDRYPEVAQQVLDQFPNVSIVAITLRESVSASHNNWGGLLLVRDGEPCFAPLARGSYHPYAIRNIVDRVGGGDAFAAGLIFALSTPELTEPAVAIQFAVASSCLAHSVVGDFNYSTRKEVEMLMGGSASGRVER